MVPRGITSSTWLVLIRGTSWKAFGMARYPDSNLELDFGCDNTDGDGRDLDPVLSNDRGRKMGTRACFVYKRSMSPFTYHGFATGLDAPEHSRSDLAVFCLCYWCAPSAIAPDQRAATIDHPLSKRTMRPPPCSGLFVVPWASAIGRKQLPVHVPRPNTFLHRHQRLSEAFHEWHTVLQGLDSVSLSLLPKNSAGV